MMRWVALAIMVLTALVLIPLQDVVAQSTYTPTGSRIPREHRTRTVDPDEVVRIQDGFAECVYLESPTLVSRLLAASDVGSIDFDAFGITQARFGRVFSMRECLGIAARDIEPSTLLTWSDDIFRFMMLERAYVHRYPAPPAWLGEQISVPERTYVSQGEALNLSMATTSFVDCFVAAAPRESDTLLRTATGSDQERAAVQAMVPFLGPCLVEGHSLALRHENIRQFAAEGLWHLATGQPGGATMAESVQNSPLDESN